MIMIVKNCKNKKEKNYFTRFVTTLWVALIILSKFILSLTIEKVMTIIW